MAFHARNILKAGAEDATGYVLTGFPAVGVAVAIVEWIMPALARRFRYLLPSTYLDWRLANWQQLYSHESPLTARFKGQPVRLPQVMVVDNCDGHLSMKNVHFTRLANQFSLLPDIKGRTDDAYDSYKRMLQHRRRQYHNDNNLRLCRVTESSNQVTLECQGVMFDDAVRTNLVLDADFQGEGNTLRNQVHGSGRLETLEASKLANHCGVNILIFTPDGQLIIQKRSSKVAVRPNEYCPSGSGTLEARDVATSMPLSDVNVLREAFEEIGVQPHVSDQVTFLGITRELIRGGQPEFFFAAKTQQTRAEVLASSKSARDRFEHSSLHFSDFGKFAFDHDRTPAGNHDFLNKAEACIDEYKDRMSIPLWTALTLWSNARIARTGPFFT